MRTRFFLLISLIFLFTKNGSAQTASFTVDKHFACVSSTIQFTNTSSNIESITAIDWDFGDGTHITDTALYKYVVNHSYTTIGKYTVTLTVTYDSGIVSYVDTIITDGTKSLTVRYSPFSGCVSLRVVFGHNIRYGSPGIYNDSLIYNIDGVISVMENPMIWSPTRFTFNNPGQYLPSFQHIQWIKHPETGEKERCVVEWQGGDTIYAIDLQPDFIADSIYWLDSLVQFENTTVITPALLADSIHWDYGNGDFLWIYNTETESHNGYAVYHTEGIYTVTLTEYYKGCKQSKSYAIAVRENDVGVKQLQITNCELRVYPNPVNNQLRIMNYELREDDEIEIYNVMGQLLQSAPLPPLRGELAPSSNAENFPLEGGLRGATIDLSHLANGMYYLRIGNKVVKFVKM